MAVLAAEASARARAEAMLADTDTELVALVLASDDARQTSEELVERAQIAASRRAIARQMAQ
ncbi:MAG: hypothetical protein J7603_11615 [Pseudacidovorax sp.]|nr:hypothetical protein [Pseudacidovorax sp.]